MLRNLCPSRSELISVSALVHYKYVHQTRTNLELACLCTRYFTFSGFLNDQSDDQIVGHVLGGYYAFQDYALTYWADHLKEGMGISECEQQLDELTRVLEAFLPLLECSGNVTETISIEAISQRLSAFREHRFFSQLVKTAAILTQPQHSVNDETSILSLYAMIARIRTIIEYKVCHKRLSATNYYGSKFFKCPRVNCRAFYEGFKSSEDRDLHVSTHDRPFLCTFDENCLRAVTGFATSRDLRKHTDEMHAAPILIDDDDFPDLAALEEAVTQSGGEPPEQIASPARDETPRIEETQEVQPEEISPSKAEPPVRRRRRYRARAGNGPTPADRQKHPATYGCNQCAKKFTRAYNLRAHLRSHTNEKPYKCTVCSASFARENDRKRHEIRHTGNLRYVCKGCKTRFARSDELQSHLQTRNGERCRDIAQQNIGNLNDNLRPNGSTPAPVHSSETMSTAWHVPDTTSNFDAPLPGVLNSFAMNSSSVLPSISNLLNPAAPTDVDAFHQADDFREENISLDFSGFNPGFDLMDGSRQWFNDLIQGSGLIDESLQDNASANWGPP